MLFFKIIIVLGIILSSKNLHSKKLDENKRKKIKLNECENCMLVTNSFTHWLDKTSRGKFEGGDAAWEEANLRSYARSEIRLVEIQEGLCSELKQNRDDCYEFVEEIEQPLEKWWFDKEPNYELYTWLCIETLHHCCPIGHYGPNCDPCILNNNKVCNGHGECDGGGTRLGNGSCVCNSGYQGNSCDLCSANFFKTDFNSCEPCHTSCAECRGPGPSDCDDCKVGWKLDSGQCVDIDECISHNSCLSGSYCINNQGSFKCKPCDISCKLCSGPETTDCNICADGFEHLGLKCIDKATKETLVKVALNKLTLYTGLLLISWFVYRNSRLLASIVVSIVSYYIYLSENSLQIKTFDALYYTYLK